MEDNFISPNKTGIAISPADIDGISDEQMYTVISIDPGGRSGWAVFQVFSAAITESSYRINDNIAFWSAGEMFGKIPNQVDEMIDLIEAWPGARIIIEDFVIRKFNSAREFLDPIRITERVEDRLYSSGSGRTVIKQPPSLAMNTVTDERLKKMGLYNHLVGQEHARDAVRHSLTWIRRAKHIYQRNLITNAMLDVGEDVV